MNPHYFGKSDQPLFGVHHPPRQAGIRSNAVLICPPIGHEYLRTHWALRLLAQRLAREGFHVLRFDYTGVGDSNNWIGGTNSLDQWIDDIHLAADNLIAESGCRRVSIVGLRLGAILAAKAAERELPLDHLVLWEPVLSGASYTRTQQQMHQQMLDLWVCPMTTDDDDDGIETLGFYYQRSLYRQLQSLDMSRVQPNCRQLTVVSSDAGVATDRNDIRTASGAEACWVTVDDIPDWDQLTEIETAWLQSKSPSEVIQVLKSPPASNLTIIAAPLQIQMADSAHDTV